MNSYPRIAMKPVPEEGRPCRYVQYHCTKGHFVDVLSL